MRIALLSLLDRTERNPALARGNLLIGGRSVLRHQLALALALGARRIAVLADPAALGLAELGSLAAAAGAQLHAVRGGADLAGLVAPTDDLLVIADGLLAPADTVSAVLEAGPSVPCIAVEDGQAAGFERIDINRADVGILRLPGRIVPRLADLPGDWSVYSALLRLAVQGGVPLRPAPADLLADGSWRLVRSEEDAHGAETAWIRRQTAPLRATMPGLRAAQLAVRAIGPALLHAGTRPALVALAAALIALLSLLLGWFGAFSAGFAGLGLGWFVARMAGLLARIERTALAADSTLRLRENALDWALDLAFVVLAAWRIAPAEAMAGQFATAAMAPLMLFGLLRLGPRILRRALARWLDDRLLLAPVLALASLLGPFSMVISVVSLGLLALLLHDVSGDGSDSPNPPLTGTG